MHLESHTKADLWRSRSAERRVEFISGIWRSYKYLEVKPADVPSGGGGGQPAASTASSPQSMQLPNMQRWEAPIPRSQKGREQRKTHQKTPAWMNRPPEIRTHRVYAPDVRAAAALAEFRHMWCMRAGRVDVCTAFCLYYKMHLSLSLSPSFCLCCM